MEERTPASTPLQNPSLSPSAEPIPQNPTPKSPAPTSTPPPPPPPTSVIGLWRPAAQRNIRNQWSNFASYKQKWDSLSSVGRSHATSIVNAYLSQRYMDAMELGVLSDMPDIRKKACLKLFRQQELHRSKLLSSYKDMVAVVIDMVKTSKSMRCFLKGTDSSPLVQFSSYSVNENDTGDGGGIPVFKFWSLSSYEALAEALVQMFTTELNLKRLLVVEFLSICCKEKQLNRLHWSDELYVEEFGDLSICNLYSIEACEPVLPRLKDWKASASTLQSNHKVDHDILQVYLTTWLTEVNIDKHRVDEIFSVIGEEIHVSLS